jgi:hypothetical protein
MGEHGVCYRRRVNPETVQPHLVHRRFPIGWVTFSECIPHAERARWDINAVVGFLSVSADAAGGWAVLGRIRNKRATWG